VVKTLKVAGPRDWPACVSRSVQTRGEAHAPSGVCHGLANHRLSARRRIAKAQKGLPAAARGETYTSNGRTQMYALGLRAAWTAQRNGFTAVREAHAGQTHVPL
jgi:hypothetical protein